MTLWGYTSLFPTLGMILMPFAKVSRIRSARSRFKSRISFKLRGSFGSRSCRAESPVHTTKSTESCQCSLSQSNVVFISAGGESQSLQPLSTKALRRGRKTHLTAVPQYPAFGPLPLPFRWQPASNVAFHW